MNDSPRLLAVEVARACGIGQGPNCCAFLLVTPEGFACVQRTTSADSLYERAHAGSSLARRTPEQTFPACQTEGRS